MESKSNKIVSAFFILLFLSCSYLMLQAQNNKVVGKRLRKVVIDAGHGGRDPGCHGQYSYEKDIALDVSKQLGNLLKQNMSELRVLYTREFDWYPELKERHKIANDAKADLFISIHINSSPSRVTTANGTETYVLGLHRNDQKEGAIGEYAENFSQEGGLLNPQDPMTQILIAQYSQTFLASSILLGTFIEDEFQSQGRKSMGVKQKGLEVLAGSAMPAVLVELGFLNNPSEEAMLNSPQGKLNCANAIYKAIVRYRKEVEKGTAIQSTN
jgi:N-acetylmuramoyl-L-alanine amidase